MTVVELADWINQNYPELAPYLKVESLRVGIYLDKKLRTNDLNIAWVTLRRNGGWRYAGESDIIDPHSRWKRISICIVRKNQKIDALLNKMKLICEGCIKIIDWYAQFPIEKDRAQLIELGMSRWPRESTCFWKEFPDSNIRLSVDLPSIDRRYYIAHLSGLNGRWVEIQASTLNELLDKIITGEE